MLALLFFKVVFTVFENEPNVSHIFKFFILARKLLIQPIQETALLHHLKNCSTYWNRLLGSGCCQAVRWPNYKSVDCRFQASRPIKELGDEWQMIFKTPSKSASWKSVLLL